MLTAIDLETNSLNSTWDHKTTVHCAAFSTRDGKQIKTWLVVGHDEVGEELRRLKKEGVIPICHNALFDLGTIRTHYNITFEDWHDTMLLAYSLKPSSIGLGLNDLAKKHLGEEKLDSPSFTKYTPKMGKYCKQDATLALKLFYRLGKQLKQDVVAWEFYRNVDLPYQQVLMDMQLGSTLDVEALEHLDRVYTRYLEWLRKKVYSYHYYWQDKSTETKITQQHVEYLPSQGQYYKTGYSKVKGEQVWWQTKLALWNPNSTDQNVKLLQQFGVPKRLFKVTETGKLSVDKTTLPDMVRFHPIAALMNAANLAEHKYTGFIKPLLTKRAGSLIYGDFNQCRTSTRRLSSSNPNLQNIPRRSKSGKRFRQVFIAPPGYDVIVGDLDRIELVVLSFYLEEYGYSTYMADAVRAGDDLHTINRDMWGLPPTEAGRDIAKTVIFALIYGAGDEKLASSSGISKQEMSEVRRAIYSATKLDKFRDSLVKRVIRNHGVFHDLMGAKYVVREVLSAKSDVLAEGTRKVGNYIIQGSAGSIFKELQNRAYDDYSKQPKFSLVRQTVAVHDEAMYICPTEHTESLVKLLNSNFNSTDILVTDNGAIPIRCSFNSGTSWAEAK